MQSNAEKNTSNFTTSIILYVSTFGGDQFKLPKQTRQLQTFFSVFYFTIYVGLLISIVVVVVHLVTVVVNVVAVVVVVVATTAATKTQF